MPDDPPNHRAPDRWHFEESPREIAFLHGGAYDTRVIELPPGTRDIVQLPLLNPFGGMAVLCYRRRYPQGPEFDIELAVQKIPLWIP